MLKFFLSDPKIRSEVKIKNKLMMRFRFAVVRQELHTKKLMSSECVLYNTTFLSNVLTFCQFSINLVWKRKVLNTFANFKFEGGVAWSNRQHRRLPLQGSAVQIPAMPIISFSTKKAMLSKE